MLECLHHWRVYAHYVKIIDPQLFNVSQVQQFDSESNIDRKYCREASGAADERNTKNRSDIDWPSVFENTGDQKTEVFVEQNQHHETGQR